MTLLSNIDLPLRRDYPDPEDQDRYLDDLVDELQKMYEKTAENVNGSIRNYADVDQTKWTPEIATDGVNGTIVYKWQYGWVLRQGIITDVWMDVAWSSIGTSTGRLYVNLPYRVTLGGNLEFPGVCQMSDFNFGPYSYYCLNARPNTYRCELWGCSSLSSTVWESIQGNGQIIGHIRYIGVEDE